METIRKKEGFPEEKLYVLPEYVAAELHDHPLTRGLHVTDIGYFPRAQYHYRERPEGCESHIVILCVAGEGWMEIDARRLVPIHRQELVLLPAGIPHRYGSIDSDPWSIYWLHLKGEDVLPLFAAYHLQAGSVQVPLRWAASFIEAFDACYRLISERSYSPSTHIHVAQTIRHQISSLGMTIGGNRQERRRSRFIDEAIHFMADHLEQSITLDQLARHVGLSRQHLIEVFREATGFPPIDYFLRMRIQRAGQLLDLTDLTVKQVGSALGFHDPYYFSRLFKKITGLSPTQYRDIKKG